MKIDPTIASFVTMYSLVACLATCAVLPTKPQKAEQFQQKEEVFPNILDTMPSIGLMDEIDWLEKEVEKEIKEWEDITST